MHQEPNILSQLYMDYNEWQCIKIHNGAEDNMQQIQSVVEEAGLCIPGPSQGKSQNFRYIQRY